MEHDFYIGLSYGVTGVILCLLTANILRAFFSFRKQIDDEFKPEESANSP